VKEWEDETERMKIFGVQFCRYRKKALVVPAVISFTLLSPT